MKNLIDTKYWLFDLDNTLYSGQTKVFSEVDKKMSSFISKKFNVDLIKAREIQKKYFYEYGTTLSGLMNHDKIDPHEFLEFVHDIDISWLPKDELLREELIKIKEKKYIFTNGSHAHVENVTKQLGIDGLFDGAFDIVDANFITKPKIQDDGQTAGKITVDITVDKNGNIRTAKAGGRGTTISNAALWYKCENAVLGCKLNALATGPEIQAGKVVFTFILE